MSRDEPTLTPVFDALRVRRNLAIGGLVGILIATLAFLYRVVLVDPVTGAIVSPWLFGGLAIVLAVTVGGMVAIVLTAVTGIRLARREAKR